MRRASSDSSITATRSASRSTTRWPARPTTFPPALPECSGAAPATPRQGLAQGDVEESVFVDPAPFKPVSVAPAADATAESLDGAVGEQLPGADRCLGGQRAGRVARLRHDAVAAQHVAAPPAGAGVLVVAAGPEAG